jgi:lipoprotein-releasing system permease protein
VVVSVMNGFDTQLKYRILGAVPHLTVDIQDHPEMTDYILDLPAVSAIARFQQRQGMVIGQSSTRLVAVYGVDPAADARVSIIDQHIVRGALTDLLPGTNRSIIGRPLGYQLGLREGDEFTLMIPEPGKNGHSISPKLARIHVAGFFELDSELDYELILLPLADLQAISGDHAAQLRVTLSDVLEAPRLAQQIKNKYPGQGVLDWTADYGDFFKTVKMEKVMMFLLLAMIVAIAAFNIVSGLSMMVKEKSSDIAVLRTLGLSSRQVMLVFMIHGSLVGAAGVVLGVLLGVPLAYHIPEVVGFFESMFGGKVLAGTYFSQVPTDVRWFDIGIIMLVSLGITVMATLYPAYRASRLQPAQVLRHE